MSRKQIKFFQQKIKIVKIYVIIYTIYIFFFIYFFIYEY